ncbi:MAG: ABC transporter permease [Planctomycetota bacterium]
MIAAIASIAGRDLKRLARQPTRVVATIGTPVLVWMLLIGGFGGSELAEGSYAAFALPGALTMVVLFGSIFGAISMIEDRQAGLLRAMLASPSPPIAIAIGKLLGGGVVCFAQALALLPAAYLVGLWPGPVDLLLAAAVLACVATGIGGLCIASAWLVRSTGGFHGIMNLVLMPLWLLSGGVFGESNATDWMNRVVSLNPLAWPTHALRAALEGQTVQWGPMIGSLAFATGGALFALLVVARRPRAPRALARLAGDRHA